MERLPSKRGLRLQQLHPIFLTIDASNKSGHLLFAQKLTRMDGKDRIHAQLRHSDTGLSGKPASAQEVEKIQSCSPRCSEQWAH